jgi:hypothetical protein
VEGRIDHCAVDVPGKRIFIAALGNGTVEVVDLAKGERTTEIKGLKEPQGLYYDEATSRLYVASAGDETLRIYEGKDLTLRSTLEFGDDADNVRYDENTGQIWVGYGSGGLGVVADGKKAGEIPLGSHPESFQLERSGSRVFVNVPKEFGVAVVGHVNARPRRPKFSPRRPADRRGDERQKPQNEQVIVLAPSREREGGHRDENDRKGPVIDRSGFGMPARPLSAQHRNRTGYDRY